MTTAADSVFRLRVDYAPTLVMLADVCANDCSREILMAGLVLTGTCASQPTPDVPPSTDQTCCTATQSKARGPESVTCDKSRATEVWSATTERLPEIGTLAQN